MKIYFGIDSIKTEMRILFLMSWMKRLLLRWYEHPFLQSSTSKIHQDTQTSLWSRGNEIHHSGISVWDQRTRREGRSTHRISYEFEQEMLKHIHKLKKDMREKGWFQRDTPEVSQTSFLRSDESDGQLGFKFEWWNHVINVPSNKTLFLEFVSKKIRTGFLSVRTVWRLSNQTTLIINMGELGRIGRRNSLSPIIPPVHHSKDGLFWILSRKDSWRSIQTPISKWLN